MNDPRDLSEEARRSSQDVDLFLDKLAPTSGDEEFYETDSLADIDSGLASNPVADADADLSIGREDTSSSEDDSPLGTLAGAKEKGQEFAGQAQEKASEFVGSAQEKADQGMDAAASGLGQAAEKLREQGEQHGGTAATAATKTADTLDAASTYLRDKDTDQILSDLEGLIRRKPAESLLAAAGIGFVLSKLLG